MKKVLIITPRSPFQERGADEADRVSGIRWFKNNGFEVRVITKIFPNDLPYITKAERDFNIQITPITYKFAERKGIRKATTLFKRLLWPPYWDGAAYEYFDNEIRNKVKNECKEWKPDLVWFDYTYLWPLYGIVKKYSIPIITRSINFEPDHFLDEDGRSVFNLLRVLPKYWSEIKAFRASNFFFAITPKEERIYKIFGTTPPVRTLPLRSLPVRVERKRKPRSSDMVHIGFMPSTYSVHHNKEALRFIIQDVVPALPRDIRSKIKISITGNRFPEEFKSIMAKGVEYVGFVPNSMDFWDTTDIALAPSLFGAGMQQKIFEPIALGVPTITSQRGLGAYALKCAEDLVCAESKEEVADAITRLVENASLRKAIGESAKNVATKLFSKEIMDERMQEALNFVNLQR